MFLIEPPRTRADLNFVLLGVPVRISVFFWLAAALLGWNLTYQLSRLMGASQAGLLLLWLLAVLVSIVIHEFGHSLAMRRFGIGSRIVLYHFGGLAVPDEPSWQASIRSDTPGRQIVISLAGPAMQLAAAAVVIAALWLAGYAFGLPFAWLRNLLPTTGEPLPSVRLTLLLEFFIWVSIAWALLNLLPVYPLDGGRIARELALLFSVEEGIRYSLILSIVSGAAVAIYGFSQQQQFLGIMFALLALSSYQMLRSYQGRSAWGNDGGDSW